MSEYKLLFANLITHFVGIALPVYYSFKVLASPPDKKGSRYRTELLIYWTVMGVFLILEPFFDTLVGGWFPFYVEIKIVLVLLIYYPKAKFKDFLYRRIHQFFSKHQVSIDSFINNIYQHLFTHVSKLAKILFNILLFFFTSPSRNKEINGFEDTSSYADLTKVKVDDGSESQEYDDDTTSDPDYTPSISDSDYDSDGSDDAVGVEVRGSRNNALMDSFFSPGFSPEDYDTRGMREKNKGRKIRRSYFEYFVNGDKSPRGQRKSPKKRKLEVSKKKSLSKMKRESSGRRAWTRYRKND